MSDTTKHDFAGKVVLITGGGTGIGRGIGEAFAHAGGTVVVTGRRIEPLEGFCAEFPGSSYVQMDVGVDKDRVRAIETVLDRHGRLDVLVNNALWVDAAPFDELRPDQVEGMYRVLLVAPTFLMQTALSHLIATRGTIINISSVAARHISYPATGLSVYSAAKAGLSQLTRALGSELAPRGVRVNAIAPGITRSESSDKNSSLAAAIAAVTPMGRLGEPSDIAAVALFLASDAATWVTGQVIDASGGWGVSG